LADYSLELAQSVSKFMWRIAKLKPWLAKQLNRIKPGLFHSPSLEFQPSVQHHHNMSSWLNKFTYPRNHARRVQGGDTIALLPLLIDDEVIEGNTVTVYDGDPDSKRYSNEGELRNYLEQFPEANNDQATRIFQYGPNCETTLKLALFEKFPFLQFSLIPSGLTETPGNAGLKIAACGCERCKVGTLCSHRAMECAFSFWQYAATSIDDENRLEVTGNHQSFAIYAGGQ
jgi:hypothetical protein